MVQWQVCTYIGPKLGSLTPSKEGGMVALPGYHPWESGHRTVPGLAGQSLARSVKSRLNQRLYLSWEVVVARL